ncbi:MAG: YihY/virulence factor BrkB family protein [Thermodesulfovibrionales bacterium]|nr:YihY/virulence factor BrkB family protein [Thermodesulfovibrionales bacterium]
MIRMVSVFVPSVKDFFRDSGAIYAAALSYFFILDIVPLCLFSVGVLGYVLGADQEILAFIMDRLFSVFPEVTGTVTAELERLVQHKSIAITSLLLYAILSLQLYVGVHKSLAAVFKTHKRMTLAEMLLKPLVLVTLVFSLLLLSFILTTMIPLLRKYEIPYVQTGEVVSMLLRYVLPLMIVQFTVLIVYVLVPSTKIRVDDAFWGGFFTAVMLETAKHFFTWYVGTVSKLGTMYGSLAVFVTFLLWMYYSWSIFLIGAEITHNLGISHRSKELRR